MEMSSILDQPTLHTAAQPYPSHIRTLSADSASLTDLSAQATVPAKKSSDKIFLRICFKVDQFSANDVCFVIEVEKSANFTTIRQVAFNKLSVLFNLTGTAHDYYLLTYSRREKISLDCEAQLHPVIRDAITTGQIPLLMFASSTQLKSKVGFSSTVKNYQIKHTHRHLSLSMPSFLNQSSSESVVSFGNFQNSPPSSFNIHNLRHRAATTLNNNLESSHSEASDIPLAPITAERCLFKPLSLEIPSINGFDLECMSSISSLALNESKFLCPESPSSEQSNGDLNSIQSRSLDESNTSEDDLSLDDQQTQYTGKFIISPTCSTHVQCTPGMTIANVIEKLAAKLLRLSGMSYSPDQIILVTMDNTSLPPVHTEFISIPFFVQSQASNIEPVFKVQLIGSDALEQINHHKPVPQTLANIPEIVTLTKSSSSMNHDPIYSLIEEYLKNEDSDHYHNSRNLTVSNTAIKSAPLHGLSRPPMPSHNPVFSHARYSHIPSYVRLELPKGIHSNIAVCTDTTVAFMLEKSVQKIQRVLGVTLTYNDLEIYSIKNSLPRSSMLITELSSMFYPLMDIPEPAQSPFPLEPTRLIADIARDHEFSPSNPLKFQVVCISSALDMVNDTSITAPGPLYFTSRRNNHGLSSSATVSSEESSEPIINISIRLILPRGVVTDVRITNGSTALHLLQSGIEKLHSMQGEQIGSIQYHVFAERPDGIDKEPLNMDALLTQIPEIKNAFIGPKMELRDTIWFVVKGKTDEWIPPSQFDESSIIKSDRLEIQPEFEKNVGSSDTQSSLGRRLSLNALLDRRQQVVTLKEVHDNLTRSDDTTDHYLQSIFATNPRSISEPISPNDSSLPFHRLFKPKLHRHSSLCPTKGEEINKLMVRIYLDKDTSFCNEFFRDETILFIKNSLLAPGILSAKYQCPVESYVLFYRHLQSQVLVQIVDEECTLYQLGITSIPKTWRNRNEFTLHAVQFSKIPRGKSGEEFGHTIASLIAVNPTSAVPSSNTLITEQSTVEERQLKMVKNRLRDIHLVTCEQLMCDRIEDQRLPSHLRAKIDALKYRVAIRLHFPHNAIVRTIIVGVHDLVSDIIQKIVGKFSLAQWWKSVSETKTPHFRDDLMGRLQCQTFLGNGEPNANSFSHAEVDQLGISMKPINAASPELSQIVAKHIILQIVGRPHYLHPEQQLIDHYSMRYLISRGETINLLVTVPPKSNIIRPQSFSWPLVLGEKSSIEEPDSYEYIINAIDQGEVYVNDPQVAPENHAKLSLKVRELNTVKMISMWDVLRNFRIQIVRAEGLCNLENIETVYAEASLACGGVLFCIPVQTCSVRATPNPGWFTTIVSETSLCDVPRNCRLCVTVYGVPTVNKRRANEAERIVPHIVLGGVSILLIDDRGFVRQGIYTTNLWEKRAANLVGPCTSPSQNSGPSIQIRFEEFSHPVVFPDLVDDDVIPDDINYDELMAIREEEVGGDKSELENLLLLNPLEKMSADDKKILWAHRLYLSSRPESLPLVLLSGKWDSLEDVLELRRLLKMWKAVSIETALSLLDGSFADDNVRSFAVKTLDTLSDEVLGDYLMQLVQALYFEHRIDSALARFLLTRALLSHKLGHFFFWTIKTEIEKEPMFQLYKVLLEIYLQGSTTSNLDDMLEQQRLVDRLNEAALTMKQTRVQDRKERLLDMLKSVPVVRGQRIPLDPNMHVSELIVSKCKVMDSKKMPLWIVFQGANPKSRDELNSLDPSSEAIDPVSPLHRNPKLVHPCNPFNQSSVPRPFPDLYVIFKTGDDLRQDALTLQMMRIMDRLWRQNGLDLRMTLYGCMSTGKDQGFIEVVENSRTVSSIQIAHGGSYAAFKEDPIECWIRQNNPDEQDYDKAVSNFTLSCAGYCVATYCLGIGDRHNDNIMCHEKGRLFHIDFGHFLGNVKRKFGIKRERVPFVLTPDFTHVIKKKNKENFDYFIAITVQAYLIIRRNSRILINLFLLMLSTGIPELQTVEDLSYLRTVFNFDMTEKNAEAEFRKLIRECIDYGWSTQLNWWVHNLAHSNGK